LWIILSLAERLDWRAIDEIKVKEKQQEGSESSIHGAERYNKMYAEFESKRDDIMLADILAGNGKKSQGN